MSFKTTPNQNHHVAVSALSGIKRETSELWHVCERVCIRSL